MQSLNTLFSVSAIHCHYHQLSVKQFDLISNASIPEPRTRSRNASAGGDDENSMERLPFHFHGKSITSPSNPFVKHCVKLRTSSSYRHSHGSVVVVGSTPIREICQFQKLTKQRSTNVGCLFLLDSAEIPEEFDDRFISFVRVSTSVMKKLSGLQSTESTDVVALLKIPSSFHALVDEHEEANFYRWFPSPYRILVLDRIQDPGNLGTLLRSAIAFKWGGVFLLPGCCDPFNEKAVRASRGASFQLPIVAGSWSHLEALTSEFNSKILAGHPQSTSETCSVSCLSPGLADSLADTPVCLILGSEGGGLSEKARQAAMLVSIPMAGQFESLNVSVAGGIFLYMLQPENLRYS